MAARRSTDRQHDQRSAWYKALGKIEKTKAQVRATTWLLLEVWRKQVISEPLGLRPTKTDAACPNATRQDARGAETAIANTAPCANWHNMGRLMVR